MKELGKLKLAQVAEMMDADEMKQVTGGAIYFGFEYGSCSTYPCSGTCARAGGGEGRCEHRSSDCYCV